MTRTILVHLNVLVPDDSDLTVDDVKRTVQGALEVGLEGAPIETAISIAYPLVEEV